MEGVELEELDAGVEVSWSVGAVVVAALARSSLKIRGRRHVRGDVEGRVGGGREVRLEFLLVQPLGWRVGEEKCRPM